jgi:hypothetical protein
MRKMPVNVIHIGINISIATKKLLIFQIYAWQACLDAFLTAANAKPASARTWAVEGEPFFNAHHSPL